MNTTGVSLKIITVSAAGRLKTPLKMSEIKPW